MTLPPSCFLFDLDGTLLDTLDDLTASTNAALRAGGFPERSRDEIRRFVGNGVALLLARAVSGGSDAPPAPPAVAESFLRHYAEHCADATAPYPGVPDLLRSLRDRGVRIGIISNKNHAEVVRLAERFFPGLYDVALGAREGVRNKPAPDALLEAMRTLGAEPARTLYVGDSETDVATARAAGVPCLAALWGFRDRATLAEAGATRFAAAPADVLAAGPPPAPRPVSPPRRRLPLLRRAIVFLAVLWLSASVLGCLGLNRLMFHPPKQPYPADMAHLVQIGPSNAPVAALWYPKDGAERAILYSHGNAEDLAACHERLLRFRDLGFSALAYDYPGYGRSAGSPTEDSVYDSAEIAYRHLVDDLGFAPSNVVVVGFSIGSGPSCRLAEHHAVGGLALFAPFKSAVRVVTRIPLAPFDAFPNLSRIERVGCPVLVAHGTADDVIPFSHGRALAEAAGTNGLFLPVDGADHLDLQRRFLTDADLCDAFLRTFPP